MTITPEVVVIAPIAADVLTHNLITTQRTIRYHYTQIRDLRTRIAHLERAAEQTADQTHWTMTDPDMWGWKGTPKP